MQLVTRPLRARNYQPPDPFHPGCRIRLKTWKDWYIRAHLMGIQAMFLGLIDEGGVLRYTRPLTTDSLPKEAAVRGSPWDPADNIHWAFRVLTALRDYCQEATDVHPVARRPDKRPPVWRVEISPMGGVTRLLIRALSVDERDAIPAGRQTGILLASAIN
jgi:hypothetical protein